MKKLLIFMAIAGAVPLAGFAESTDNYSGAYYNLNAGAGKATSLPDWSPGGSLNAGYDFNRYFALEGGYTLLSSSQFNTATVTSNILDVAARGTLPLGDTFGLYGRLGVGYMMNLASGSISGNTDPNCILCQNLPNNAAVGLAGIGASFSLNRSFDLRLEDTIFAPAGNTYTGNINTVMLGFQYNFNRATSCTTPALVSNNDYSLLHNAESKPEAVNNVVPPVATQTTTDVPLEDSEEPTSKAHCNYKTHRLHVAVDKQGRQYLKVRICDTLYGTWGKTGVSIQDLKRINNLESDEIEIGTRLYLVERH